MSPSNPREHREAVARHLTRDQMIGARVIAQSLVEELSERISLGRSCVQVPAAVLTGIEGSIEDEFRRLARDLGFKVERIGLEEGRGAPLAEVA